MIPLVALVLPVLITMTAFAVDLGRQRSSRRTMQAVADVIALDMSRLADGRSAYQIVVVDGAATDAALAASATRNEVDPSVVTSVVWGEYEPGTGFQPHHQPGFLPVDDPTLVPNAVEITTSEATDYFFRPGTGTVTRTAIGTTDAAAIAQIGSGLVNVDSSASVTLDAVLRRAFGINSAVALGLLNYNGLAGATIGLGDLATALGFGSPTELAEAQVTARDLLLASADILELQGNTAGAEVLEWYGTAISGSTLIHMGDLLQLEQNGPSGVGGAAIDAFGLLTGAAYVINGTNTINIPSVTTNVAGVTGTSMALTVTQTPVVWSGSEGAQVDTQQVGLTLSAQVDLPLDVIGLTGARLTGRIPIQVSVAGARGTITDIDCSSVPGVSIGADGRPVGVQTGLDMDISALVPLLGVRTVATLDTTAAFAPPSGSNGARFDHPTDFLPDVGTGGMVHAPGTTIGLSQALTVSGAQIVALGILPLDLGALSAAINTALQPVLDQLATYTVSIAAQLGVDVGGSDIAAIDMTCGRAKLVG
ncbi:MAG: pilus assembly protein TadG-related protein [Acidimicrobiia bacterium]